MSKHIIFQTKGWQFSAIASDKPVEYIDTSRVKYHKSIAEAQNYLENKIKARIIQLESRLEKAKLIAEKVIVK